MLDKETKQNLAQYLDLMEAPVVFSVSTDDTANSQQLFEFVNEVADMTDKITVEQKTLPRTPSFEINSLQKTSGITFAGIPLGHEFASFLLALLQVSGRPPKIADTLIQSILEINQPLHFESYVSLTCHNCPDVVQALNILAVLNPLITHTMIEGGMYQHEITEKQIMAVPTVFLNEKEFARGRMTIEQILGKIAGPNLMEQKELNTKELFDVLVIGGGPAASSAAIYAVRKGLRTGLVTDTLGGQVVDTLGIENLIGTPYTEGPRLMKQVEEHLRSYPVAVMTNQQVVSLNKGADLFEINLKSGNQLKSKTTIVATGAHWRSINVPGEKEFKNKGIAYCPHCDGPLFAGKEIAGQTKVDSLSYIDRSTQEEHTIAVSGVFILIGLVPNTDWLVGTLELNDRGEIITDAHGATSEAGLYAAGDCTDSAYKQIIIAMGSGATAALGSFDYLMRKE